MDNYRYYLDDIEVFPLNKDDLKFNYEKKSDSASFFEKTLETTLIFNYESGNFNFKTKEEEDRCAEIVLVIEKFCGKTKETFFEGAFSIMEGEFDDSKCQYSIKPRIKTLLMDGVEINILKAPNNISPQPGVFPFSPAVFYPARKFEDVILYLAQETNPNIQGVISNVFQINPDGAFYLNDSPEYSFMAFSSLSDVQSPAPSNPSTKEMVTFKDVMDDLNILFRVFWFITSDNYLRIEHEIWFDGSQGLDLTTAQYEKYVKGKNKYNYDLKDYPKQESWKIVDHYQYVNLTYIGLPAIKKNESVKGYQTKVIRTDVYQRVNEGGAETGLFLWLCNSNYECNYSNNYYRLMPSQLVRIFHTYNRPSKTALLELIHKNDYNNQWGALLLDSVRPTQKQVELSIPVCCGDEFNPEDQITTELGTGYVQKATFNTKDNLLTTELKYRVEQCDIIEPDDIDGLDLWLKSGDYTLVSGLVSQWNDSSGNARHAVQGTPANRPTITFSNAPTFSSGRFLTTPSFQLFPGKRGTVFMVFQLASPGSGNMSILSTNDGGVDNYFDISLNAIYNLMSVNESVFYPQVYDNGGQASFRSPGVYMISRGEDIYIKSTQNGFKPLSDEVQISNTQITTNPLIIGSNPNNIVTESNTFALLELIVFNRNLTVQEKEKINLYLIRKGIFPITPFLQP